jgi:hypothetical protein
MWRAATISKPGGTCTVDVTFRPTGTGLRRSAIVIYPDNIFSNPPVRIQGIGIVAPVPASGRPQLLLLATLLVLGAFCFSRLRRQAH